MILQPGSRFDIMVNKRVEVCDLCLIDTLSGGLILGISLGIVSGYCLPPWLVQVDRIKSCLAVERISNSSSLKAYSLVGDKVKHFGASKEMRPICWKPVWAAEIQTQHIYKYISKTCEIMSSIFFQKP